MVVGGGSAREHALVRALRASDKVSRVLYVPGNSAVEHLEGVESAPVASLDLLGLVELAEMEEIDLTVVGPNTPLVMGLVDRFREHGLRAFGPHKAAARLEGSKVFAKNFMMRCDIPTARFAVFEDTERAAYFCQRSAWARVVKTDGLAYERGVAVCHTVEECEAAIQRIMVDEVLDADGQARVVVEERLRGPEITLCVLSDGDHTVTLDASLNYPRALDGNQGMRTRGMGAISPAPGVDAAMLAEMEASIVMPTIRGITDFGPPLVGALFVDIIVEDGRPYVLDFNVRFGDPATQVLVARLQSDLFELLDACVSGELRQFKNGMQIDPRPAVSVVVATGGYPAERRRDDPVTLEDGLVIEGRRVLDVGALRFSRDQFLTTGGRVATVTALGDTVDEAAKTAYEGVAMISFEGKHVRQDIGDHSPL